MMSETSKDDVLEVNEATEEVKKTESVAKVTEKAGKKTNDAVKDVKPYAQEKDAAKTKEEPKKEEKKESTVENLVIKDGKVSIFSKDRAGKSIIAVTGQLITFDGDGYAAVDPKDALYLQKIKGIEIKK